MLANQPDWSSLSPDLWRRVLLMIRAEDWSSGYGWTVPPNSGARHAWEQWWALVARVSST